MEEILTTLEMTGFDELGEPEIRTMADGSIVLAFNFMPPSWAEEHPETFDDFDQQLAKASNCDVFWEDREMFIIEQPASDTVERLREFLEQYPKGA